MCGIDGAGLSGNQGLKMRVLMVSKLNTSESYGGSNRAYYLGKYISEHVELFQLGVDCSGVDYCDSESIGSLSVREFYRKISEVIAEFRPDVVYSFESRANLACEFSKRKIRNVKFIYDFCSSPAFEWYVYLKHGRKVPLSFYRWIRGLAIEKIITSSDALFIAAGEFLRDVLTRRYKVPPERVFVIPNGAPPEMLDNRDQVFENPYIGDAKRIAMMIGPRDDYTNILAVKFLHRVADRLESLDNSIQIVILGGGPIVGSSPNIRYTGYVKDVRPYIDHADLCLLPYPREAVCGGPRLKSLEYFSRKKLVLSTPEGLRGLEGFRHLEHVYLSTDDPGGFSRDLARVIREKDKMLSLGENAHTLTLEKYNWQKLADSFLRILARL